MNQSSRKQSNMPCEDGTAHDTDDTDTQGIRDSKDSEAVGRKPATVKNWRVDGVMEQWLDVPTGKQKSDGSGERN